MPGVSSPGWCAAAATGDVAPTAAGSRTGLRPGPFEETTRWLRGRIVDRLRDAADGRPVDLRGPLGSHSADAVTAAVTALARDGILELDAAGHARLAGTGAAT